MADFDFSTLITDRSASDLELLRDLLSTPMSDWTAEQLAEFNQAVSKGAYNYTDLNRVTACMEYLDETLRSYGYRTGYQRIVVPHQGSGGSGSLPDGYTELEYIQSSGDQYIDTGFIPNQDSRIVYDMERVEASAAEHFFGVRTGSSTVQAFNFYIYNSGWRSGYNATTGSTDGPGVGRYSVDKNKNVTTIIPGNITMEAPYANFTASGSALLFAMRNTGASPAYGSHRLYSCQIYDDGELVRDYVPCLTPEGDIGLYDLVGGEFYGNDGSGEFFPGPETNLSLPEGYTQLEYIESSGEQYIDTGVSPNQDTRITMTAMLTEAPSEFAAFFGARTGGNSQFWLFWNGNSNIFQGRYGTATIDISVSAQQECVCDFNKNNLSINGTSGYTGAATFQSSYSAYLCGVNSSGALQYPASIRISSCEIYNDGTLVRSFVPVKDESGAVGLYDTTGKSFYANAGSGSFTAGPEVPAPEPDPEPEPLLDPYTWYEADVPTESTMEAYLGNVSALRSVLTLPEDTAQVPGNMAGLTTTEANQIEEILSVIGAYLEAMITVFRRCGAAICGGPGFYFVN